MAAMVERANASHTLQIQVLHTSCYSLAMQSTAQDCICNKPRVVCMLQPTPTADCAVHTVTHTLLLAPHLDVCKDEAHDADRVVRRQEVGQLVGLCTGKGRSVSLSDANGVRSQLYPLMLKGVNL